MTKRHDYRSTATVLNESAAGKPETFTSEEFYNSSDPELKAILFLITPFFRDGVVGDGSDHANLLYH